MSSRRERYKKGYDVEDARRRREEAGLSLRKNRREDSLLKRRREAQANTDVRSPAALHSLARLPEYVEGVMMEDRISQIKYTSLLRRLLSIERKPPIKEVVESGIVPRFVQFLAADDSPQLQFEAAWALTNIASGDSTQTLTLIEHNAVPQLVSLLRSPNLDVVEQAVWALGNIAGDNTECRDFVLQHNALEPLLEHLLESQKVSLLRNGTWTLSNFCRGKPSPPVGIVDPCLEALRRLIYTPDEEVLSDALWALSYLSDGSDDRIQRVLDSGVARRVVELLLHPSPGVQTPALRTIGNFVSGTDRQTELVLGYDMLDSLLSHLHSSKKGICKEACWTVSNVTAGTTAQIQRVLDCDLIPALVDVLRSGDFDLKKEAAWAISNATSGGSPEQIKAIAKTNCVAPLCDLLSCTDASAVMVTLDALENILKVGDDEKVETGENVYTQQIIECDGSQKLVDLQHHQNPKIYKKALMILNDFFETEDVEDQNVLPELDSEGEQFVFGQHPSSGPTMFDFRKP